MIKRKKELDLTQYIGKRIRWRDVGGRSNESAVYSYHGRTRKHTFRGEGLIAVHTDRGWFWSNGVYGDFENNETEGSHMIPESVEVID
jgi:hypothetical protein